MYFVCVWCFYFCLLLISCHVSIAHHTIVDSEYHVQSSPMVLWSYGPQTPSDQTQIRNTTQHTATGMMPKSGIKQMETCEKNIRFIFDFTMEWKSFFFISDRPTDRQSDKQTDTYLSRPIRVRHQIPAYTDGGSPSSLILPYSKTIDKKTWFLLAQRITSEAELQYVLHIYL